MATECRKTKKHKLAIEVYIIFAVLVTIGLIAGWLIGRYTFPVKAVTLTETVEVPAYNVDELPTYEDVDYYDVPLSHSLQRYIYEICTDEEVPVSLIIAMIDYESNFNPEIVSDTDDYGLLQINKINHETLKEQYKAADMLDPYQNVFCGVKVIGSYIKAYDGDYNKALMAYNMGEYGAKKAWKDGIKSTSYSNDVINLMSEYEQEVIKNVTNLDTE